MDATHFLIERERRAHTARLAAWAQRVRIARRAEDALRLAGHESAGGPLLRSLRDLSSTDLTHARRSIDAALQHRLGGVTDPREQAVCLSLAARLPWAPSVQAWRRAQLHARWKGPDHAALETHPLDSARVDRPRLDAGTQSPRQP